MRQTREEGLCHPSWVGSGAQPPAGTQKLVWFLKLSWRQRYTRKFSSTAGSLPEVLQSPLGNPFNIHNLRWTVLVGFLVACLVGFVVLCLA